MDKPSYASKKSDFVSGHTGTSISLINLVCLTAASSYALWLSLPLSLKDPAAVSTLLLETIVLGFPLLAVLTLASEHAGFINAALIISAAACRLWFASIILRPKSSRPRRNSAANQTRRKSFNKNSDSDDTPRPSSAALSAQAAYASTAPAAEPRKRVSLSRPFVTVYRAHMMIMTVLCILAVDFHIFPRGFAKCEVWGTSIMDLGVGSFVFSLGLVQSLPILREEALETLSKRFLIALKHSFGVLGLGLIRLLMVKGTSYPGEHVTEYGVHWNFFITLALLPLAGSLLRGFWPKISYFGLAFTVASVHQLLLSYGGLQNWTLTAPRTGLISANKEGITSLPGYVALFLFGVDAGLYILPPRPDWAYIKPSLRLQPTNGRLNTLSSMLVQTFLWWFVVVLVNTVFSSPASRVLANFSYVVWVCAFNVTFLTLYSLAQTAFVTDLEKAAPNQLVPQTFSAINKNGMAVFLFANVLTGLVNLSINTLTVSQTKASAIMSVYLIAVLCCAWRLRCVRYRI